jgi:glycosyltransferase involved in cell wall biosynthesis
MVDAIVVNSQAVRRHLVEDERVPDRLIHVCHNGVDTNRYRPGPRCPIPELGGNSLVVGVVSAFRPEKDLPALLEAFARVRHLRPGLKLALVGDGPELERLRRDRDRLKLAESCHIEPATNDVPRWLRAIDIFVLPSLSEAFSNSLMEAMASGCCAVASQTGGNPELVEHGRTGLLFRPGDAGELAACLRLLIENDALRNQYAAAGADFMHENFSLQASAQRMGEIYRNAMMST